MTGANGSKDRDSKPPCEVRGELNEYEKEEQWLAKRRKHMAILRNDHTSRSSNSFNECFAIPSPFLAHTLVAHGRPAKKARTTPTDTNTRVSVQEIPYMCMLNGCANMYT